MQTLPLALYAGSWRVVLAGGTDMAHAKARILAAACDGLIWVGAPADHDVACDSLARPPLESDFHQARLAVISTGDKAEEERLAVAARGAGALVNVVDRPQISDFSFPALIDRGAITIAVASGGAAPVVARWARGLIERALPARLGELAEFVSSRRTAAKTALGGIPQARRFWDRALEGAIGQAVLRGEAKAAEAIFTRSLADGCARGCCTIVHVARADSGELTLAAQQALCAADHVIHSPVAAPLLDMARRDSDRESLVGTVPIAFIARAVEAGKSIVILLAGPEAATEAAMVRKTLDKHAGVETIVTPTILERDNRPVPA